MKYWNRRLQDMTEYLPGEQPEDLDTFVKLNTNENPFPPSPQAIQAMKDACGESLRLYPNPMAQSVREVFAKQNNLDPDNIFIGNGSDEVFTLIFRGFIEPTGLAAFPYPSYSLYYVMAEANGISYEKITMNKNFEINFNEYLKKKYDLVIISNPNNPTGGGCKIENIKKFLSKFKGLLVVDEAYVDFYGESALPLIREHENLLVTRSFSKSYSLAGLRVGIAAGHRDLIRGFLKLKDSYNVDRIAQIGAREALLDTKTFEYNLDMIKSNKEYLEERLTAFGFTLVPSQANFIFVKHPNLPAEKIYTELKENNVLVRYFDGPMQSEYVRITVGSMMELKTLMKKLEIILEVG